MLKFADKMIIVRKYDLPDFEIFESQKNSFFTWIPDKVMIVLGASNTIEDAVFIDAAEKDKIPVYKRPSGGQTVMLTPNTLVISTMIVQEQNTKPKQVFNEMNALIVNAISLMGFTGLGTNGISDITLHGKKILGSSIYRKKEKVFYHAVLNVTEDPELFEKYLKHPVKEPEYRQGRSHKDFVTSLQQQSNTLLSTLKIEEIIEETFEESLLFRSI